MKKGLRLSCISFLVIFIIIFCVKCSINFLSSDTKLGKSTFNNWSSKETTSPDIKNISKDLSESYISIINSIESLQKETYTYKLAYINDDDIPELIINDPGYSIGIIMYLDGNFYSIAEHGLSKIIENNKIENLMQLGFPLVYGLSNKVTYSYIPKGNTITCKFEHPLLSRLEIYDIHENELNVEYSLSKTRFKNLIYSSLDEFNKELSDLENIIKENPKYSDNFSEKYYLNKKQIEKHTYDLLTNHTSFSLEATCMSSIYMIDYIKSITN